MKEMHCINCAFCSLDDVCMDEWSDRYGEDVMFEDACDRFDEEIVPGPVKMKKETVIILFLSPSCGKEEPIMNEPEPVASVNQKDISHMSDDEIREMQKQADEDFYQAAMENAPVVEVNTNIDELFKI